MQRQQINFAQAYDYVLIKLKNSMIQNLKWKLKFGRKCFGRFETFD